MASDLRFPTILASQFRPINTPPNRPKWNMVSKKRSVNSYYNPTVPNGTQIRRGWNVEVRQKRVHKLPPLKRKREEPEKPQLAIEAPPPTIEKLALDYHHDPYISTHDRTVSIDHATVSSRRSSRALVPSRRVQDLQLVSETPRSQRPIQQEWYDDLNKSQLIQRVDTQQTGRHSFRNSVVSNQPTHTPRDQLSQRSVTQTSQHSAMTSRLLDASIRTNRATELRLSRDLDEHHQHCHSPNQSLPLEIRGFQLEGSNLTVPDNATIRPLSNVNYRASERIKHHRIYPWSNLHASGASSRNGALVPIAELRRPSFEDSITGIPPLMLEE